MNNTLTEPQRTALAAGVEILLAVLRRETPALTHGWHTVDEPGFYNDYQREHFIAFGHDDDELVRRLGDAADSLGLGTGGVPGLTNHYVFVDIKA